MNNITFARDAFEEYLYWQGQDKKVLGKINNLLKEISRTSFEGSGKPEALKGDMAGLWSRRINDKDRLVYEVKDDTIFVVQCKGHYTDK